MHPSLDAVLSEFDPLSSTTSATPPPISLPRLDGLPTSGGEFIISKAENRRNEILFDLGRDPFDLFAGTPTPTSISQNQKDIIEKGKSPFNATKVSTTATSRKLDGREGKNELVAPLGKLNGISRQNQLIPTPAMSIPALPLPTKSNQTAIIHKVEFDENFFEEERIINLNPDSIEIGGWSDFISIGNSSKSVIPERSRLVESPLPELPKVENGNLNLGEGWKSEWNYDPKSSTAIQPIKLIGVTPGLRKALLEDIAEGIRPSLPPRLRISQTWKLLYSLDQHGTSLKTMYECMDPILGEVDGGCVVVIKDTKGGIFGGFINEGLRDARRHYGDGTCFLWKATPFPPTDFRIGNSIKTFTWTGKNDYYILTNQKIISLGGGNGKFGFWIDKDFLNGITSNCPCFENEPLTQEFEKGFDGDESTFEVLQFEIWSVGGY